MTTESTHSPETMQGTGYVARVKDVSRELEFHSILGKNYIDGELHYMVDWVPTLVRGHVLRKSQVPLLISRFKARCQCQGREM